MGFNVILQEEEEEENKINVEALKGSELSSAGLEKMEPLIKLKTCTVFVCSCFVTHSPLHRGHFESYRVSFPFRPPEGAASSLMERCSQT